MQVKDLQLKGALRSVLLGLLLSVVTMGKMIAQNFTVNNLNYSVNSDGVSVTLTGHVDGQDATGELVIPEDVTYGGTSYSVTTIGNSAFSSCSGFTGSLIIPNSVTSIGNSAFRNCSGLTGDLVISNSVTTIGNYAFAYCRSLTGSLTIGNSVTVIGNYAFAYCMSLTGNLIIPNSLTMIGKSAFDGCSGFTSLNYNAIDCIYNSSSYSPFSSISGTLTIGDDVHVISAYMFNKCSFTGSLTIGNSVTTIGESAFENCGGFTGDLVIPNSVTTISNNAFKDCNGFTGDLIIPNSVTTIKNGAFNGCSGLTGDLAIPNSVITIDNSTFRNCSSLTGELVIPNSVTSIGNEAFYGCRGFMGALVIPNSVTSIGNKAFYECSGFTGTLDIPNSVSTIGEDAFYGTEWYNSQHDGILYVSNCCLGYKGDSPMGELILQEGTRLICDHAFSSCSDLTGSLTIGNSVTSIGNWAFAYCSGFTGELVIPNSVTSIGNFAFNHCSGFTGSLTIGNSVTAIGYSAFAYCSSLTGDLVIPNSVTSIGEGAFSCCSGLTGDLVIPNSVTSIGRYAFNYCSGLTGDLIIPNSVTMIGERAFSHCSGLTGDLVIPNSVNEIGDQAFSGCSGFTGNLVIPNSITTIGNGAFWDCSGLTGDLVIPNSVTTIGNFVFAYCNSLTGSLTIGDSITSIGEWAFAYCSSLMGRLTIGNSVTAIGNNAFQGCWGLSEVIIFRATPASLSNDVFYDTSFPIYVPYESLNTYKSANGWNNYANRIYPMTYKAVSGYGEEEGNWCFIASPLMDNTNPTTVNNMITETPYDLYCFNQSEDLEWQNYKAHMNDFVISNGQGYLYANSEDVNIFFKGNFNEDDTKEVSLTYDANATFAGWNLVGNPFPTSAYANKSYYTMNEDGTAIEPVAVSMETAIPACTGVMVKAESPGETVTFSKTASRGHDCQGCLQISVAQNNTRKNTIQDKVIVSYSSCDRLEKYIFNKDNAQLYIPQGGKDYAIACVGNESEMPLNFKTTKNGQYTISVNPEAVEMGYLHLVDNLTGANIDLLATPNYTFEAKIGDYASRFRLVFSARADADGDNDQFAYYANGEIQLVVETCHGASLQIVDAMGRIVCCTDGVHTVSTSGMVPGVYVLRLIDGDVVRTQKIVIE